MSATPRVVWDAVVLTLTGAFLLALWGRSLARRHQGPQHARVMLGVSIAVGTWLVGYATKQVLLGRDTAPLQASGRVAYLSVLIVHVALALLTLVAWSGCLVLGLRHGRHSDGVRLSPEQRARHRRWGTLALAAFGGTLATSYVVYAFLVRTPAPGTALLAVAAPGAPAIGAPPAAAPCSFPPLAHAAVGARPGPLARVRLAPRAPMKGTDP